MTTGKWLWAYLGDYRATWRTGLALLAVSRIAGSSVALGTKFLVDDALRNQSRHLLPIAAGIVGAVAVQAGAAFALTRLIGRRSQRMLARLRAQAFSHVLRFPASRHDASSSGGLATQIFHDTDVLRHALGFPMMDFAGAAITCAVAGAILAYLDWILASIVLLLLAVFAAGFRRCALASKEIARERASLIASASGRLAESLGAIRAVKAFAAEGREEKCFAARLGDIVANADQSTRLSAAITATHMLLSGGGAVLLLAAGAQQVAAGRLTTGGLLAAVVLCGLMAVAFVQAGKASLQLAESLAGAERIRDLLATPLEDDPGERPVVLERLRGWLEFEDVRFAYDRSMPVLDGITFRAAPGTVIAVQGASGAGKSTIASLAAGLYRPTAGRVLVDGINLRDLSLASYRRHLGLVPQESLLMDGTIAENVALGRPGASEQEIREACRAAYVDEFVERLPLGYETVIGERGVQLSGGQRQRVAIARALLVNPRILILDEPTAMLDAESEHVVQKALQAAMRGRTTLLITHRESAIRRADQVLVLEDGRIAQHISTSQCEVRQA